MARVAEQAERFDDMVEFLRDVIKGKDSDFTTEERNLLSVGFKNQIGGQRTAIRTIAAIEQNPKYQKYGDALASYKKKIEDELFKNCDNIAKIIQNEALKHASDDESKAFFYKMIGDYYRYIAESATGDRQKEVGDKADENYGQAGSFIENLNACNPIRLGLALNQSVFFFEIKNDRKKACDIAEKALQEALEKIDDCDEDMFRDAKSIIELLKENLSLWKEEEDEGKEVEEL